MDQKKKGLIGLAALVVLLLVLMAASGPLHSLTNRGTQEEGGSASVSAEAGGTEGSTTVVTGEAEGFGGTITAEVTLDENNTIVGLNLTGDAETPDIGGAALEPLKEAILAAGTVEGVDAVAGATWTSDGVFDAVRSAMGIEPEPEEEAQKEEVAAAASGLTHGIGFVPCGSVGYSPDDQGANVYTISDVIAYVLFDGDGRILDLEVDTLEVTTPNSNSEYTPRLTGFPGQSYNADEDFDGTVDTVLEQTEDAFLAEVDSWVTKRDRGDTYKMTSGTWAQEMDIYEEAFRGMTIDELKEWVATYCSDTTGRSLHGNSEDEADQAKYEALSDEQKAEMDAISGATMSVSNSQGDIIGAIEKAYENRVPAEAESIARIGLGITDTGRLGPGSDDQEVGVYSFNTQVTGACFDGDGRIVALLTDVMEVATPNYDGASMPDFTGFPGQSYNADEDHDGTVDTVWEQDDDTFMAQFDTWKSKRERGDSYKLNSGTWTDEMNIFQEHFLGMTADEVADWFETYCSEVNGRPLHGTSEDEKDVAKYEALSEEQKAEMDAISGATMSLRDGHGDILGSIQEAWEKARDTTITLN